MSASARKRICVICPLPPGAEVLMAVLSVSEGPLYPITALSQPIQLLVLIAFFHLQCAPLSLFCTQASVLVLEGPSTMSLRSHLPLTSHLLLQMFARMNKQCGGYVCMCRAGEIVKLNPGWSRAALLKPGERCNMAFTLTIIQGSSEQEIIDSTHACTSRRLT